MLSVKELSVRIKKSEKTILRWIKANLITAVPMGREYRINESEVDRIISCGVSLKRSTFIVPKKKPVRRNQEGIRPWER
jgi:excisionase family DNA binding protein